MQLSHFQQAFRFLCYFLCLACLLNWVSFILTPPVPNSHIGLKRSLMTTHTVCLYLIVSPCFFLSFKNFTNFSFGFLPIPNRFVLTRLIQHGRRYGTTKLPVTILHRKKYTNIFFHCIIQAESTIRMNKKYIFIF